MRAYSYIITVFLLALVTSNGLAQISPRLVANLDTTKIRIGEQVTLRLKISTNSSDTVVWPLITDTLSEKVEIVDRSNIDTSFEANNLGIRHLSQNLIITSFDSGYYPLKPFVFLVNGNPIESEAFLLEVGTLPIDTAKAIVDIKGPMSEKYSWLDWIRDYWEWPAGILGLIAAIAGLIYYIRERKKRAIPPPQPPKPKIPAHIIALDKLDALKEEKLWQSGNDKAYHSQLSEIIREYIENRYQIQALEQTTREIMQSLRYFDLEDESRMKLKKLLTLSDLVKFAKEKPLATENEGCLSDAYAFVKITIPRLNEQTESKQ